MRKVCPRCMTSALVGSADLPTARCEECGYVELPAAGVRMRVAAPFHDHATLNEADGWDRRSLDQHLVDGHDVTDHPPLGPHAARWARRTHEGLHEDEGR